MDYNPDTQQLTVCDAIYTALCDRAYHLYITGEYTEELLDIARRRLEILDASRTRFEMPYHMDYKDAYSHWIVSAYALGDYPSIETALRLALSQEVSVSLEAESVLLTFRSRGGQLTHDYTAHYYRIVEYIDLLMNQSPQACALEDTRMQLPFYDETVHRACAATQTLHRQLVLDNAFRVTVNRSLNLAYLSKAITTLQGLCRLHFPLSEEPEPV